MIALADLRSPAVAIDWHEAVAVVAALADLVEREGLPVVPRLEDVRLAADGTIAVVRTGPPGEPAAAALAARLGQLLEAAPCPAELRQLIDEAESGATLDRLREGLGFFERPGRDATLSALAVRAGVAVERVRAAAELERLTERARQPEPGATASSAAGPSAERRPGRGSAGLVAGLVRQYALPLAVGASVFVAMAIAAATFFPGESGEPASAPADTGPEADEPPPRREPDAVEASVPPAATPSTPQMGAGALAPAAVPPAARASSPAGAAAATATPTTPAPPAPPGVEVRVNELGGTALPSPNAAAPRSSRATGPIYAAGEPGVTPARLIRPHLPAEPPADVPPEQVGTLEFVVDERGTVETVHLISPANRYQERMLVAAAKTWVFSPATKDGRPVRFRARLRVTL